MRSAEGVEAIGKPQQKHALRLTATLLVGISKIHLQKVCAATRAAAANNSARPPCARLKCPARARLPHAHASYIAGAQVNQFANTVKTGARPPMRNPPPHSPPRRPTCERPTFLCDPTVKVLWG